MPEHNDEQLSPQVLADLESDHLDNNPPDDDGSTPRAFSDPAGEATPLGIAVIAKAVEFLQIPLRENAGVNQDKQGYIRSFFLEGLKWSPELWDHWIDKHPQSKVIKPEWCAAFGSYCVRKAYEDMGVMEFAKVDAQAVLDNDSRVAEEFDAKRYVAQALGTA